jgi:hypothetical protein
MVEIDPRLVALDDEELASAVASLVIRRRAAGFTPVLIVSASEHDGAISDTSLPRDAVYELLEYLLASPAEPLHEPPDQ